MELIISLLISSIIFLFGGPVFVVFLFLALLLFLYLFGIPVQSFISMSFSTLNDFTLVAAPLFVFAGYLMIHGGLSEPLVRLLRSFTGHLPGGLAIGTIIASCFIGALTGSVMATLAAVGVIMFPAMQDAGYDKGFSSAVLASSMGMGYLIPPSLLLILYSFMAFQDVSRMFLAGIVPGLFLAAILSVGVLLMGKIKNFPVESKVSWKERGKLLWHSIPAILMPVIVLGGIYGGIFTPTEAASVACAYAIFTGIFIYRKLQFKEMYRCAYDTVKLAGSVFMIVAAGMVLGRGITLLGLGSTINAMVLQYDLTPFTFLFAVVIAFIVLGCIMEGIAILVISIPLLMPTVNNLGIDPIFFGIVISVALVIATLTPPMSIGIYAASGLFSTRVGDIIKAIIPLLMLMIIALFLIAAFPQISLFLPNLVYGVN